MTTPKPDLSACLLMKAELLKEMAGLRAELERLAPVRVPRWRVTFHKPAGLSSYQLPGGGFVDITPSEGVFIMEFEAPFEASLSDEVRRMVPDATIISIEPAIGEECRNWGAYPAPAPSPGKESTHPGAVT